MHWRHREAHLLSPEEVLLGMAADLRGCLGGDERLNPLPVAAVQHQRVEEPVVLVGGPLLPRIGDGVRLPELLPRHLS